MFAKWTTTFPTALHCRRAVAKRSDTVGSARWSLQVPVHSVQAANETQRSYRYEGHKDFARELRSLALAQTSLAIMTCPCRSGIVPVVIYGTGHPYTRRGRQMMHRPR